MKFNMSAIQIEGLWQFIQTLTLSNRNKQWLADRLIESMGEPMDSAQRETDYLLASEEMKKALEEGDRHIKEGNYQEIQVSDLWK